MWVGLRRISQRIDTVRENADFDCWVAHHYGFQRGYKQGFNDSIQDKPYDLSIPPTLSPQTKDGVEVTEAQCPDCKRLGYVTNFPSSDTEC